MKMMAIGLAAALLLGLDSAEWPTEAEKVEEKAATAASFRQKMAKFASAELLMEQNKAYPMLHDPAEIAHFQRVDVTATGYTAGYESTGKHPEHPEYGFTFSGVKVRRDIVSTIAADPQLFPLGTVMFVPGYGYAIVADTGSAIQGNIIDLYFETQEDVYTQWGKRHLTVFVIRRGNGAVTEEMMQQANAVMELPALPAFLVRP